VSFSKGNSLAGSFENIEAITFNGGIFSESQFFSICQIKGLRDLSVNIDSESEKKVVPWSTDEKERCNLLMKDLKSLRIKY
jgi:hypothetical protein